MAYKNIEDKRIYEKKYRHANKDKKKKANKKYYQSHKEEFLLKMKEYHKNNKEYFSLYKKQWYLNNIKKHKSKCKKWRENNKELKQYMDKKYREANRDKRNKLQKERMKIDIKYNLCQRMGSAIRKSLKSKNINKGGRKWEDLVGYTAIDLKKCLQFTMPEGYSWQDFLNGELHIDHIIPKSAFNFTKPEHTDFKKCWALKNLRLLPAEENIRKSNKLYKPFQPSLEILFPEEALL